MKPPLTTLRAKKIIKQALSDNGLPEYKLTGKTVGFVDLARDHMIFITVHNWKPDPRAPKIAQAAIDNGFRCQFR